MCRNFPNIMCNKENHRIFFWRKINLNSVCVLFASNRSEFYFLRLCVFGSENRTHRQNGTKKNKRFKKQTLRYCCSCALLHMWIYLSRIKAINFRVVHNKRSHIYLLACKTHSVNMIVYHYVNWPENFNK